MIPIPITVPPSRIVAQEFTLGGVAAKQERIIPENKRRTMFYAQNVGLAAGRFSILDKNRNELINNVRKPVWLVTTDELILKNLGSPQTAHVCIAEIITI